MARELAPIDISSLTAPALTVLAKEVSRTRRPRLLRIDTDDFVALTPIAAAAPRRRRRVLRADDPIFDLVGIGRSGGPGDVSANKHRYLAKAYRAESERDPAP